MSAIINYSVNLENLPKEKFVKGKKGTYYNFTVSVNDEIVPLAPPIKAACCVVPKFKEFAFIATGSEPVAPTSTCPLFNVMALMVSFGPPIKTPWSVMLKPLGITCVTTILGKTAIT